MTCPTEETLLDAAFGEASGDDARAVDVHLRACAACRQRFESFAPLLATLGAHGDVDPPRHLRTSILTALGAERAQALPWYERLLTSRRLPWSIAVTASAAAVALFMVQPLPPVTRVATLEVRPPATPVAARPPTVTVRDLVGPAQAQGTEVAHGATVVEGSPLRVAPGGRCLLDWRGAGTVAVDGPASLTLAAGRIDLAQGRVVCHVEPGPEGFRVRTDLLEAAVVGTHFTVTSDGRDRGEVEVFEGTVTVTARADGSTTVLAAGQRRGWRRAPAASNEPSRSTSAHQAETTRSEDTGQASTLEEGF
jgi:hypothetical protein